MATHYSKATPASPHVPLIGRAGEFVRAAFHAPSPSSRSSPVLALLSVFLCATFWVTLAGQEALPEETHQARAQRMYREAKSQYEKNSSTARAAWELARACYDLAEFAPDAGRREELAKEGIGVCRLALQQHPRVAPVHYYMALNLGQLARIKMFSALGLIGDMEKSLLRTAELDSKFDYAGAHRALGLLYRDAPGWPVSLGSKTKARARMQKALSLAPDYPGNHLNWMESLLQWGEKEKAREQIDVVRPVLDSARDKLTGERWALSWEEWRAKWRRLLEELNEDESPE